MAAPYKPISLTPLGEVLADTGVVVMVKHVGEGWVDDANTTIQLPCPFSKCRLVRAGVYVTTVPADAEGVMTYALIKREAAGDSDDAVSAVESAETLTASEMRQIALAGTVTDRTFLNGDILEVDLLSGTDTIDTNAVDLTFILEFVLVE
jgi:hypothetical protein